MKIPIINTHPRGAGFDIVFRVTSESDAAYVREQLEEAGCKIHSSHQQDGAEWLFTYWVEGRTKDELLAALITTGHFVPPKVK